MTENNEKKYFLRFSNEFPSIGNRFTLVDAVSSVSSAKITASTKWKEGMAGKIMTEPGWYDWIQWNEITFGPIVRDLELALKIGGIDSESHLWLTRARILRAKGDKPPTTSTTAHTTNN